MRLVVKILSEDVKRRREERVDGWEREEGREGFGGRRSVGGKRRGERGRSGRRDGRGKTRVEGELLSFERGSSWKRSRASSLRVLCSTLVSKSFRSSEGVCGLTKLVAGEQRTKGKSEMID